MNFTTMTANDIKKHSAKIWENIIAASNAQDYPRFSQDFSREMKNSATPESIAHQWQQAPSLTRLVTGPECLGYLHNHRGIRVLWKQNIQGSDEEHLGHLELVIEDGCVKVDGAQII